MPVFHRLMRAARALGPDWRWGGAFLIEQPTSSTVTAVVTSGFAALDTPIGAFVTDTVSQNVHTILAGGSASTDTPTGDTASEVVGQSPHTVSASGSVVLV